MVMLIMADGTRESVSYNQAAKLRQVMDGEAEPKTEGQAAFAMQVKQIIWSQLPEKKGLRKPQRSAPDENLKKLMSSTRLKGLEKARAIARHIKER